MPRPRREPMDIITSIVEKRQPLTLRDVRYFARCYVALALEAEVAGREKADELISAVVYSSTSNC